MANALKVGDTVRYYCTSQMTLRDGVVTAVDVPVEWLHEWPENGTIVQSPHPQPGRVTYHPLGVQINGTLTRAYYGDGTGQLGGYDKSRVAA